MNPAVSNNPFDAQAAENIAEGLSAIGEELATTVQERLSIPCPVYHTGHGRHSLPGEHPYMETGNLRESIDSSVDDRIEMVSLLIATDVPYAFRLQERMDRPIFTDLLEEHMDKILSAISNAVTI